MKQLRNNKGQAGNKFRPILCRDLRENNPNQGELTASRQQLDAKPRKLTQKMKTILTTPTPQNFPKKYAPETCHTMGSVWHKSPLKSRDFYRNGIRTQNYGIRPPPFLCHIYRFICGGWSSNLLNISEFIFKTGGLNGSLRSLSTYIQTTVMVTKRTIMRAATAKHASAP